MKQERSFWLIVVGICERQMRLPSAMVRLPSFGHLNGASIPSFQKFQFLPTRLPFVPLLSYSSRRSFRCSVRSIPTSYRRIGVRSRRFVRCDECLHNSTSDSPVTSLHFMQCRVFRQLRSANIHSHKRFMHARAHPARFMLRAT